MTSLIELALAVIGGLVVMAAFPLALLAVLTRNGNPFGEN